MQSYTETWVGFPLTPAIAYGFRFYHDGAILNMHVDKSQTHIISMIYHIDHDDASEPWPILIEVSLDRNLRATQSIAWNSQGIFRLGF